MWVLEAQFDFSVLRIRVIVVLLIESKGETMQSSAAPLEVTYLRTTTLKPDPRNPRVHTDKQVRQIAQSIESFGFNVPLLIDDQQQIIAGHGRLMAARKPAGTRSLPSGWAI